MCLYMWCTVVLNHPCVHCDVSKLFDYYTYTNKDGFDFPVVTVTIAGAAGVHMDTCTCIDQLWPLLSGTYAYNSHVHSLSYLDKFVGQMPTCSILVPVRLQRYCISLAALILAPCKCCNVEDTNHEQPTS